MVIMEQDEEFRTTKGNSTHLEGKMNFCTKFHGNPSSLSRHCSLDRSGGPTNIAIHRLVKMSACKLAEKSEEAKNYQDSSSRNHQPSVLNVHGNPSNRYFSLDHRGGLTNRHFLDIPTVSSQITPTAL